MLNSIKSQWWKYWCPVKWIVKQKDQKIFKLLYLRYVFSFGVLDIIYNFQKFFCHFWFFQPDLIILFFICLILFHLFNLFILFFCKKLDDIFFILFKNENMFILHPSSEKLSYLYYSISFVLLNYLNLFCLFLFFIFLLISRWFNVFLLFLLSHLNSFIIWKAEEILDVQDKYISWKLFWEIIEFKVFIQVEVVFQIVCHHKEVCLFRLPKTSTVLWHFLPLLRLQKHKVANLIEI